MPRSVRNLVLLLLLLLGGSGSLFATVSATATLTVNGPPSGTGDITVSFNGYIETVHSAQFASPASLADGLAAKFSSDYHKDGLWAMAGGANASNLNVITFQLTNGQSFGPISYTFSTPTSFSLAASGFAGSGSVVADTGTVSLYLGDNPTPIASTHYGAGATPESVAEGLAAVASSSLVTVHADGGQLYLTSTATGSGLNYAYSFSILHDTMNFTSPSFQIMPMSGSMTGGADSGGGAAATLYSYTAGYDVAGNVNSMNDVQNVTGSNAAIMGSWTYTYDPLNRLIGGQSFTGSYSTQTPYLCWSYDVYGNRTHQALANTAFTNATGDPCQTSGSTTLLDTVATYTDTGGTNTNRIVTTTPAGQTQAIAPSYDGAGDVTNDGANTYLYDAEGRVCAMHGPLGMTGYQYDASGDRVGKGTITSMSCDVTANGYQPTNDYILDLGNAQMTELASGDGGTMTWQHTNVTAGGTLIATYDLTGLHFYLDDPLGSRRVQTDAAGVWEQNCLSLPYGDQLNCHDVHVCAYGASLHRQGTGCGKRAGLFWGEVSEFSIWPVDEPRLGYES